MDRADSDIIVGSVFYPRPLSNNVDLEDVWYHDKGQVGVPQGAVTAVPNFAPTAQQMPMNNQQVQPVQQGVPNAQMMQQGRFIPQMQQQPQQQVQQPVMQQMPQIPTA